jgi:hypothetical protein
MIGHLAAAATLVFISLFAVAGDKSAPADSSSSASDFAFIQGAWRADQGDAVVEERWTDDVGGVMLGVGRTIKGGRTVFFEFLRIERRRDGNVYYVAQPRGNPPTDFKLTSSADGKLVFENPKHDFPQKITYERVDQDTVRATISGPRGGTEASESWEYKRVK